MVVRFGSAAQVPAAFLPTKVAVAPAAETKAPAQLQLVTDAVELTKPAMALPPFELALPECEARIEGLPKHQQADSAAALIGTLGEIAKEALTVESLKQLCERASELQANPEQSIIHNLLGDDIGPKILAGLGEIKLDSSALLQPNLQQMKSFFAQVIQQESSADKPIFGMSEAETAMGLQTVQRVLTQFVKSPGSFTVVTPFRPPLVPSKLAAATAARADALPNGVHRLLALGEAGLEMMIALAGKLAQGDHTGHLTQLQGSLEALKQQKLGMVKQIMSKEAELRGTEYLSSVQAEEARKASEAAKNCAIVAAVFAVIVAVVLVVLAVVLAVATFGIGLGASIPIIMGGVTLATVTVTAATLACVVIMAVCAAITAVMTIIANLPNLIRLAALIMKAAGNDGLAQTLENAAKWFEDNVTNTAFFKTFNMVVTLSCALITAVCSLGVTVADQVVSTVSKVVSFATIAMSLGTSLVTFAATKARLEAEYALSLLKSQLAKVEVEIKRILTQIRKLECQEEHEQQRIRNAEEMQDQIMKNLSACVDSLAQIRAEVSAG